MPCWASFNIGWVATAVNRPRGFCRSRFEYSSTPAAKDPPRGRRPYHSLPARLLAEMLVEKLGNLAEGDGGLGQAIVEQVLRVRLTFVDPELRLHPGRAERTMHPRRVAQQEVACAGGQNGGRESVHVAVDRRYQRVLQVMAVSIHYRRV